MEEVRGIQKSIPSNTTNLSQSSPTLLLPSQHGSESDSDKSIKGSKSPVKSEHKVSNNSTLPAKPKWGFPYLEQPKRLEASFRVITLLGTQEIVWEVGQWFEWSGEEEQRSWQIGTEGGSEWWDSDNKGGYTRRIQMDIIKILSVYSITTTTPFSNSHRHIHTLLQLYQSSDPQRPIMNCATIDWRKNTFLRNQSKSIECQTPTN